MLIYVLKDMGQKKIKIKNKRGSILKNLRESIDIYKLTMACGVGNSIGEHNGTGRYLSLIDRAWGVCAILLSFLQK